MNAEVKANIDALRKTVSFSMETFQLVRGSEDALLDLLEGVFAKYYRSSDEEYREGALVIALEMCVTWNNTVDELGDSAFHKDALTKRFLKIICEE